MNSPFARPPRMTLPRHGAISYGVVVLATIVFCAAGALHAAKDEGAAPSLLSRVPIHPKPVKIKGPLPAATNLVFIILDTVRADRLGCYGYPLDTTPEIDKIAREGILFERFYAASPWTAPSFGSMFTGVSPAVHRTGRWLAEKNAKTKRIGNVLLEPLSPSVSTMAELFQDFSTAAFVTNGFLQSIFGFKRGFDHYDFAKGKLVGARRAREVTDHAVKWMTAQGKSPFMSVVHYFDPHTMYEPLPDHLAKFVTGPPPSQLVIAPFPSKNVNMRGFVPTQKEKAYIIGLYNGELHHVDQEVGRLVEEMKQQGLLDKTWLVITADHGEEHFDHGGFNHGLQYEDEVTRVPLIIRAPGGVWGAGTRVQTAARHVDLLPTFLDWFSIAAPPYLEGQSLMHILRGEERAHRKAYMEFPLTRAKKEFYAYFDGRYKIIKDNRKGEIFLYDLHRDPGERRRLGSSHPHFAGILNEMEAYRMGRRPLIAQMNRKERPTIGDKALSKETADALKAMGYVE